MRKIGVTGGIGSGKTLVCDVFRALRVPVYEADREARRLMEQDPSLRKHIKELIGKEAFLEGKLNRSHIASRVFEDPETLQALNNMVHPAVHQDFQQWCQKQTSAHYVIEEAAVLYESGGDRFMDAVVLVYAPEELRMERVMKRDGVSGRQVQNRMKHQIPDEEKRKWADHIIFNENQQMILPQIVDLHQHFMAGAAQ